MRSELRTLAPWISLCYVHHRKKFCYRNLWIITVLMMCIFFFCRYHVWSGQSSEAHFYISWHTARAQCPVSTSSSRQNVDRKHLRILQEKTRNSVAEAAQREAQKTKDGQKERISEVEKYGPQHSQETSCFQSKYRS